MCVCVFDRTRGEDMKGTPVEGVELTNGEVLACDAVVVGAGVIPNATLVPPLPRTNTPTHRWCLSACVSVCRWRA